MREHEFPRFFKMGVLQWRFCHMSYWADEIGQWAKCYASCFRGQITKNCLISFLYERSKVFRNVCWVRALFRSTLYWVQVFESGVFFVLSKRCQDGARNSSKSENFYEVARVCYCQDEISTYWKTEIIDF